MSFLKCHAITVQGQLYILSSILPVKPEEGDHFLFWGLGYTDVFKFISDDGWGINGFDLTTKENTHFSRSKCSNVIIATTDPRIQLPTPTLKDYEFLKNAFECVEVLVEYEKNSVYPMITSDNFINIKSIKETKETWTKEEVEKLIKGAYNAGRDYATPGNSVGGPQYSFDEWVSLNL